MQDFDFGLGEDLDTLRDTVAKFAAERIAPLAADIDRTNRFPRAEGEVPAQADLR
jgi:isovaleryl-CoA dehydrogenase